MLTYWRLQKSIDLTLKLTKTEWIIGNEARKREIVADMIRYSPRMRDIHTRRIGKGAHTTGNYKEWGWKPNWLIENLYDYRKHFDYSDEKHRKFVYKYRYPHPLRDEGLVEDDD